MHRKLFYRHIDMVVEMLYTTIGEGEGERSKSFT